MVNLVAKLPGRHEAFNVLFVEPEIHNEPVVLDTDHGSLDHAVLNKIGFLQPMIG